MTKPATAWIAIVAMGLASACDSDETKRSAADAAASGDADSGADAGDLAANNGEAAATSGEPQSVECPSFDDTFAAIQHAIFERHGCTESACHGSAASGGLDLRKDVAYANLVEARATATELKRIEPGEPLGSFLYQKLQAATMPGSVQIAGSPMPSARPALSAGELEAVRIWIGAGAPEKGSVGDSSHLGSAEYVADLLGACLPPAEPVAIAPLLPPPAEEGVQLEMPAWTLPAGEEREICFGSYYDLRDQVPERFQSDDGAAFHINGLRLRQDPNSHHFIMTNPGLDESLAHDPSFGKWVCYGGERAGEGCEPLERGTCGSGAQCATESQAMVTCGQFGPSRSGLEGISGSIVGSQTAQYNERPMEGVYRAIPIKGFVYFNVHAFNLTNHDQQLHARVNLFYTDDKRFPRISATNAKEVYAAAGIAPFATGMVCGEQVMPPGAKLVSLGSHTHKRGKRFWAEAAGGEQIYESLVYSDPVYKYFDPPRVFDASDDAQRTIKYCALFNNGVNQDGTPDVSMVTRLSTMPERTTCSPVACATGRIGAKCAGADDHTACDSAPGAGDGQCDACAITAGPTTENEMFVLMPSYILPK